MRVEDFDAVLEVERSSFASPWTREHFQAELEHGAWARPQVVMQAGRLAAYAVVWEITGELRINNLAVDASCRRRGVGGWLLRRILEHAQEAGCDEATLEVRPSNVAALKLYRRFGFKVIGRRVGYYARDAEDALVMRLELTGTPD